MATFKEISAADIKTSRSALNQLVDIIQEDISGSDTRRQFQVFVTGGIGQGVTSSLFQTIYDQDHTLQSANAVMDMTVGLYFSGSTVQDSLVSEDASGKLLFPSESLMMREKVDVYKQFAATLLGDADAYFTTPFGSDEESDRIDNAFFVCFKRLFARDKIKRETFAMRFYQSASLAGNSYRCRREADLTERELIAIGNPELELDADGNHIVDPPPYWADGITPNLNVSSTGSVAIFTDIGAATSKRTTFGGEVADIVDSADTSTKVGLLFYDAGVAVFNIDRIIDPDQAVMGIIDGMNAETVTQVTSSCAWISYANNEEGNPEPDGNDIDSDDIVQSLSAMPAGSSDKAYVVSVSNGQVGIGYGWQGHPVTGTLSEYSNAALDSNDDDDANPGYMDGTGDNYGAGNPYARFVPDFLVSGSIDNIVDHFSTCRFQSGSLTAITFQNVTTINSTLIFCRTTADEFNYSSNPTYIDEENRVRVIDEGQEDTQRSFTFATTVGMYDANDNLLAVAKLSRPIEKNDEKDITIRVRLDF